MNESEVETEARKAVAGFLGPDFAIRWFRWIEWVTLTGAMWAVSEKTGAFPVKIVAIISGGIVFFTAMDAIERNVVRVLPKPSAIPKWIVNAISLVISVIPLVIIYFLASVFTGLIT